MRLLMRFMQYLFEKFEKFEAKGAEWERQEDEWYNKEMAKALFGTGDIKRSPTWIVLAIGFVAVLTVILMNLDEFETVPQQTDYFQRVAGAKP